ncbi:MAG TPA: DMT family transporter [Mycobacterium sp.]|nr:DMT family transporter [Mycobacterium sp.]
MLLAVVGAVSYGVTVVLGRRLAADGLGPATALGTRFLVAAAVLALVLKVRGMSLRPEPGETVRLLLLGAIGYAAESTLFFLALQRGTAATCALLFYAYPALVVLIELARRREHARPPLVAALALSTAGVVLIVVSGQGLEISILGIVLALGSGLIYAVYLLIGRELGRRSDAMVAACWLAVGAALSCLTRGVLIDGLDNPSGHWQVLFGYGVATAVAFWLTFAALSRIGASRTAVVMTFEAVTAAALGVAFLGENLGPLQAIGGTSVLAAAVLIAMTADTSRRSSTATTIPAPTVAGVTSRRT